MNMKRLYAAFGITVVLALGSQVQGQGRPNGTPNCNGRTIVLIADGITDLSQVATNMDSAYVETRYSKPILRPIPWLRSDTPYQDYRDRHAQMCGAARMVQEVKRIHECYPNSPIVLMGFCAGSHVVLLAAQQLPPNCVDKILLMAPAVSSCYDIRPALNASKLGIDVFYNIDDECLEWYELEYGPVDLCGCRGKTAGTTGFLIAKSPLGRDPIFCKLHQYNAQNLNPQGSHYGTINPLFLQRNVLSLIPCGPTVPFVPAGPPDVPAPPSVPPPAPQAWAPGLPPPPLPSQGVQGPPAPGPLMPANPRLPAPNGGVFPPPPAPGLPPGLPTKTN
jgi:hypothetical protein